MARIILPHEGPEITDYHGSLALKERAGNTFVLSENWTEIVAPVTKVIIYLTVIRSSRREEVRIYLDRFLTEDEISSLPKYYCYEYEANYIYRLTNGDTDRRTPMYDWWAPYVVVLEPEEDIIVGIEKEGSSAILSSRAVDWYDNIKFHRIIEAAEAGDEISYEIQTAWWQSSHYPVAYKDPEYGTYTSYIMPPIKLSDLISNPLSRPSNGSIKGLRDDGKYPKKNTDTGLHKALFPSRTLQEEAPRTRGQSGVRSLMLDDYVEPMRPVRLLPSLLKATPYSQPLQLGVREDGTGYRLMKDPDWMSGEKWDLLRREEKPISRVYIWRSRNAVHMLFGMLCWTQFAHQIAPLLMLTPMVFEGDDIKKTNVNLRGLPPAILSELHKVEGLTGTMAYALNTLQGRLVKWKKNGLDRMNVHTAYVEGVKPTWEMVVSLGPNVSATSYLDRVTSLDDALNMIVRHAAIHAMPPARAGSSFSEGCVSPYYERMSLILPNIIVPVDAPPSQSLQPVATGRKLGL